MSATADSLAELYREQVLAHSKAPVNFRNVPDATYSVTGNNPLCGDKLQVYISTVNNQISDVSFEGSGCAISVASASMMSQMLSGQSLAQAQGVIQNVKTMLAQAIDSELPSALQEAPVAALAAVRRYPSRVKCASLAWHAVDGALTNNAHEATTE